MAVSPTKIRIKVTMYRELATLILADAERLGTTRSELITKIVTEHYEQTGQYQNPDRN